MEDPNTIYTYTLIYKPFAIAPQDFKCDTQVQVEGLDSIVTLNKQYSTINKKKKEGILIYSYVEISLPLKSLRGRERVYYQLRAVNKNGSYTPFLALNNHNKSAVYSTNAQKSLFRPGTTVNYIDVADFKRSVSPDTSIPHHTPQRRKLQSTYGLCVFRWPSTPPVKEVLVTGIYDRWGRPRVEKLSLDRKGGFWGAILQVSIPDGETSVDYSYIVDGVRRCNEINDWQPVRSVVPSGPFATKSNSYTLADIAQPVWVGSDKPNSEEGDLDKSGYYVYTIRTTALPLENELKIRFWVTSQRDQTTWAELGMVALEHDDAPWVRIKVPKDDRVVKSLSLGGYNGKSMGFLFMSPLRKGFTDPSKPTYMENVGRKYRQTLNYISLEDWHWIAPGMWKESVLMKTEFTFVWKMDGLRFGTEPEMPKVGGEFNDWKEFIPLNPMPYSPANATINAYSIKLEIPIRKTRFMFEIGGRFYLSFAYAMENSTDGAIYNVIQVADFEIWDEQELQGVPLTQGASQPSESDSTNKVCTCTGGFELSAQAAAAKDMG
ncbi:hypothetical protein AA313_de0205899 [Arthrobotrys entomopaga]|nr:hypothetical protein AA313_de0205899 [Arthrobotrys entomopaga]